MSPEIEAPVSASVPTPPLEDERPEAEPEKRERRRSRILFTVIPVVVVVTGTTLAIQHLPYTSSRDDGDRAQGTPSVSASASLPPSASPSGSPSGKASPGKSSSPSPASGHEAGGAWAAGAGNGGGSQGSGSSAGSGSGGSGSTGSKGSGSSSGSTGSGTSTDSPTTNWITKAGSNGGYKLYNEYTGQCLTANVNQLAMTDCGSGSGQDWRTGTSTTLVNLHNSMCLDESATWPAFSTCGRRHRRSTGPGSRRRGQAEQVSESPAPGV